MILVHLATQTNLKMGIIYQCKIRCLKVKEIKDVDLSVISDDMFQWKKELKNYKIKSKQNIDQILAVYSHFPQTKDDYFMSNLFIPEGTNVIAVGNDACDQILDENYYGFDFFDKDNKQFESDVVYALSVRNNFMIVIPKEAHHFNYSINNDGDEREHNFDFKNRCQTCQNL